MALIDFDHFAAERPKWDEDEVEVATSSPQNSPSTVFDFPDSSNGSHGNSSHAEVSLDEKAAAWQEWMLKGAKASAADEEKEVRPARTASMGFADSFTGKGAERRLEVLAMADRPQRRPSSPRTWSAPPPLIIADEPSLLRSSSLPVSLGNEDFGATCDEDEVEAARIRVKHAAWQVMEAEQVVAAMRLQEEERSSPRRLLPEGGPGGGTPRGPRRKPARTLSDAAKCLRSFWNATAKEREGLDLQTPIA